MKLHNIIVSEKSIGITKCDKNFKCLKENTCTEICKVERCLENKICFLKENETDLCINKIYFGDAKICNCPVRIEIFNKYGY